ncbi:hypothetical protein CPB86DRAFT_790223 [Serendipita vermifera]|nr:hypothetical protein CPB86DRAFT_790223 [Serendipita vermifera]
MSQSSKGWGYFIKAVLVVSSRTLAKDLRFRRLIREDDGVIGNAWFCACREDYGHEFANTLRLLLIILFSPLYYIGFYFLLTVNLAVNFLRLSWIFEKIETPNAVLYNTPSSTTNGENPYVPGQFRPRWLIKVTYSPQKGDRRRNATVVSWDEEHEAISHKGYTALSYAYRDAQSLFREKYPNMSPEGCIPRRGEIYPPGANGTPHIVEKIREDPLMTAWAQSDPDPEIFKRWHDIALRQINARVFLDCYLDARFEQREKTPLYDTVEYIWLDEFCLYPAEEPSLEARDEELGRMADIFGFASDVCVYCPVSGCGHVSRSCAWGSRLWTLSEIVRAERVTSLTRTQEGPAQWSYSLVQTSGSHFRSQMQREAELKGQWHLHGIMRHANNGGSTTWQQSIHSLVVEAIIRNSVSNESNKFLAKALNGLLPRRARPKDLLGKDGWADLAWLLELNQGFYNTAALAAVCGLGETKAQGKGWLGPPIRPTAGNERLEPLVSAFPVPIGLFVLNPKIIGLRKKLKRDLKGMYRTKKLILFQALAVITPWLTFLCFLDMQHMFITAGPVSYFLFIVSAFVNLVGSTLYVEKSGFIVIKNEKWDSDPNGSIGRWLGKRDSRLEDLSEWGTRQLAPKWNSSLAELKKATIIDLQNNIRAEFCIRDWEGRRPNAVVPIAVHGCGITCLILHHFDDVYKPAIKLGIVNMAPYTLNQGVQMGSLEVGAVPIEEPPQPAVSFWQEFV